MRSPKQGSFALLHHERDGDSAIRHAFWSLKFALAMKKGSDEAWALSRVRNAVAAAMVELETLPPRIRPSIEELEQQRRSRDEALAEASKVAMQAEDLIVVGPCDSNVLTGGEEA